jgi:hypothetical protein
MLYQNLNSNGANGTVRPVSSCSFTSTPGNAAVQQKQLSLNMNLVNGGAAAAAGPNSSVTNGHAQALLAQFGLSGQPQGGMSNMIMGGNLQTPSGGLAGLLTSMNAQGKGMSNPNMLNTSGMLDSIPAAPTSIRFSDGQQAGNIMRGDLIQRPSSTGTEQSDMSYPQMHMQPVPVAQN